MTTTTLEAYRRHLTEFDQEFGDKWIEFAGFDPNEPRDKDGKWAKTGAGLSPDPATRIKPKMTERIDEDIARELLDGIDCGNGYYTHVSDISYEGPSERGDNSEAYIVHARIGRKEDVWGVGTMDVEFIREADGTTRAYHDSLYLNDAHQGKGVAQNLLLTLAGKYQDIGIDRIEMSAGASVGGYAWARAGARIKDDQFNGSRESQIDGLLRRVDIDRPFDSDVGHEEVDQEILRQVAALRTANRAGEDIQPIHIAAIGERTHRVLKGNPPVETWPGKEALLHSYWTAVFYFDARNNKKPVTAAGFDPNEPRDKDGKWTRSAGGSAHPTTRTKPVPELAPQDFARVDGRPTPKLAETFNGLYTGDLPHGFKSVITSLATNGTDDWGSAVVAGHILDEKEYIVGRFARTVTMRDGELVVHHDSLTLDTHVQGKGIAAVFNQRAIDGYRKLGVDRIELDAGMDVGGFAWAREGYRLTEPHPVGHPPRPITPEVAQQFRHDKLKAITSRASDRINRLVLGNRLTREQANEVFKELDALEAASRAGEDVQPIHIASLGEETMKLTGYKNGREYPSWPGKEILLGSYWKGVYYFDEKKPVTAAGFREDEARDWHGRWTREGLGAPLGSDAEEWRLIQTREKHDFMAWAGTTNHSAAIHGDFKKGIQEMLKHPELQKLTKEVIEAGRAEQLEDARKRDVEDRRQIFMERTIPDSGVARLIARKISMQVVYGESDDEGRKNRLNAYDAITEVPQIVQPGYTATTTAHQAVLDLINKVRNLDEDSDPYAAVSVKIPGLILTVRGQGRPLIRYGVNVLDVNDEMFAQVKAVGAAVRNEIEFRMFHAIEPDEIREQFDTTMADLQKLAEAAYPSVKNLTVQVFSTNNKPRIAIGLHTAEQIVPLRFDDPRRRAMEKLLTDRGVLDSSWDRHLARVTQLKHKEILQEVLSEVRPLGGTLRGIPKQRATQTGKPSSHDQATFAASRYPTDWIEASSNAGELTFKLITGRANYKGGWSGEISLNGDLGVAVHELGHRMEYTVPGVRDLEKFFYDKRTAGETPIFLKTVRPQSGYGANERTRPDGFFDPYVGKVYSDAYEVLTMGYEHMHKATSYPKIDAEYKDFILGMLVTTYRRKGAR